LRINNASKIESNVKIYRVRCKCHSQHDQLLRAKIRLRWWTRKRHSVVSLWVLWYSRRVIYTWSSVPLEFEYDNANKMFGRSMWRRSTRPQWQWVEISDWNNSGIFIRNLNDSQLSALFFYRYIAHTQLFTSLTYGWERALCDSEKMYEWEASHTAVRYGWFEAQ
jgi:hypothetical protein